ncbi:MarR family winged helix-turn-helix transcriptional regulator [Methanobacterium aggregans]|uniref:MarR family winged helix-turn-helix transcriptional regulator n=1 Tax=Methanobacterium aggregans TaxID=1615586 RepID=UPI0032113EE2
MEKNELMDLDDFLIYQIYGSARLLRFQLQKLLDANEPNFTPEQAFLLYKLYMDDGQSQRQLADKILNDYPNITRLIDKLENKGYVRREIAENDRRMFKIYMSEKGKSRFNSFIPLIMHEREKLLEGISSDEEKIVKNVLKRIEENVRKYSS